MDQIAGRPKPQFEICGWQSCVVFACTFALLVSRRPDAVFHAQFWAEDGTVFYADAYDLGWWASLVRPYGGYLHALPRLAAALSLLVPFARAPLVMNLIAISFQALPVNLLLSRRSSAWGSLAFRAALALMYIALPDSRDLAGIITNSQSPLALSSFLIIVSSPARGMRDRLFDISILLLTGLSGPYCLFLLPIALFVVRQDRSRWRWDAPIILALSCFVEAWGLLILSPTARPHYRLGATMELLARILGGQVYLGALLGGNNLAEHPGTGLLWTLVGVSILGTAILAACFLRSTLPMKLFLLFSFVTLATSLISPMMRLSAGSSLWELMAGTGNLHYWFFPSLAFAWSLLWCLFSRTPLLKIAGAYLMLVMCFGVLYCWRFPAFNDLHFSTYAARFETLPAGERITIPENPDDWRMDLVKRGPGR